LAKFRGFDVPGKIQACDWLVNSHKLEILDWDQTRVGFPQPITGLYLTWYIKPQIFAK
jgi:hypothetical protein